MSLFVTKTRKPSMSEAPAGMEEEKEGCLGSVFLGPERGAEMDEEAEVFWEVVSLLGLNIRKLQ